MKLFYFILLLLVISSCDNSKRGNWSENAKKRMYLNCKAHTKDEAGIKAEDFCHCLVKTLEKDFTPDEADKKFKAAKGKELAKYAQTCFASTSEFADNKSAVPISGSQWTLVEKHAFLHSFTQKYPQKSYHDVCFCVAENLESKYKFSDLSQVSESEMKQIVLNCKNKIYR